MKSISDKDDDGDLSTESQNDRNYKREPIGNLELKSTVAEMKTFIRGAQLQIWNGRRKKSVDRPRKMIWFG